jgi:DNA-binding CsgD family transcriptional regulator
MESRSDEHPRSEFHQPGIRGGARLTARQNQVVELARLGMPAKKIARHLGISKRTVEAHLNEARQRTGAANVAALVSDVLAASAGVQSDGSCSEMMDISEHLVDANTTQTGASRPVGRPTVMTADLVAMARELLGMNTVSAVARKLGVSRTTLYAHMVEIRRGR